MLVRTPFSVVVVVSLVALAILPVPASAMEICRGQPWCTIGQCDPTGDESPQCDRTVGPVTMDCDADGCWIDEGGATSGRPPADHFLDPVTNLVYQRTSGGLTPIGTGLAGQGYSYITITDHQGLCSTTAFWPCELTGACAAALPAEGLLCVEFNVQLTGCHTIDLAIEETDPDNVFQDAQVYPIYDACAPSACVPPGSGDPGTWVSQTEAFADHAEDCVLDPNGVGFALTAPTAGTTTQYYFHQTMGTAGTCNSLLTQARATLAIDLGDFEKGREFQTQFIPYCEAP